MIHVESNYRNDDCDSQRGRIERRKLELIEEMALTGMCDTCEGECYTIQRFLNEWC